MIEVFIPARLVLPGKKPNRNDNDENSSSFITMIQLTRVFQTQPVILDTLTPIDEDIEEENEDDIPEIIETAPSPSDPPEKEIKQIESVL